MERLICKMTQPQVSKDRLAGRLDQLIVQADAALATHTPNPPNVIGFPTLNKGQFQQWKVSSENLIQTICGAYSSYLENFRKETKHGAHTSCVDSGKGVLIALKDDMEAGMIGDFSDSLDTNSVSMATIEDGIVNIQLASPVYTHIKQCLDQEDYFHAVEEAYKVVREKLREVTGKEKASDVFNLNAESNKYHKRIFDKQAEAGTPESDFFRGVGYLNLAIQFLRNEKSHTLATTLDKNLAIHYLSLASLAYDLISRGEGYDEN